MSRLVAAAYVMGAAGQEAGTLKKEKHPQLDVSLTCTKASGCTKSTQGVVIDSNWRWTHKIGEPTNCYTGNEWSKELCPDVETCLKNCVLEGADEEYTQTYGINAKDDELKLGFVTKGPYSTNVGSRTYLMKDDYAYHLFQLKNKEFTFDVDVSKLPCGLNGALYFVQMDADGGKSKYPSNKAGAHLGTGYCDAQCPHDLKWINGEPNILDWTPSKTDKNAGFGKYGTCCPEMDIWEANSRATAYTAHSCDESGQMRCGDDKDPLGAHGCGDTAKGDRFKGHCDKNGCDFATRRLGDTSFFGAGSNFTLDSTKPMTVVTQFITNDGTDMGKLTEIKRFYIQNGKTIETPSLKVGSGGSHNSISEDFCKEWAADTKDGTNFVELGGLASMDDAMSKGMVLVMSLWDDHEANMLWLDSTYPTDGKQTGAFRGPCPITSGDPKDVEKNAANSTVTFSNIRFGEIGSTTLAPSPSPTRRRAPTPPSAGTCCWGGASCDAATDCHADTWCDAAEDQCTGACRGVWCPKVEVVV